MTLPASGNSLSLNQLHVEAGGTSGTLCSLNDSDIRAIIDGGDGASQNIQQYFGQSSIPPLAGSAVVATGSNTTSSSTYSFSFAGGVSDHDVIIVGNFQHAGNGGSTATYPYVQSVSGARWQTVETQGRFHWSGSPNVFYSEISMQTIVCGANTPNSFTWNANDTRGNSYAGFAAIKYSTDGTTYVNGRDYSIFGTSSTQGNIGSVPVNTTSHTNTSIDSVQVTPNASTQDGVISVAFKGGNNPNDWSFPSGKTGDVMGTQSMFNYNEIKYYAKAEPVPASGNYVSTDPVLTGWGGTSWIYAHMHVELVK